MSKEFVKVFLVKQGSCCSKISNIFLAVKEFILLNYLILNYYYLMLN